MKVIVTVVPMAGHVGPVSGLVDELVRRGHDVRVYTGARYRQRFAEFGARVITWQTAKDFDEDDLAATFPLARHPGVLTGITLVKDGFIGTAPGQVADLNAELNREPADVLIADSMSFGGVLAGELRGLPWALVNVLPFNQGRELSPPGFRVRPMANRLGRQRDRLLWLVYRAASFPMNRAYNRARLTVGLPRDRRPYGSALMSDWLVLATGCPALDVPRLDLPASVHFVGRLAPAGGNLPGPADTGPQARPLVLVTQGTHDVQTGDLIQPALRALADVDADVLATTGRRGCTDLDVQPPANAHVVDLVDFATVLPRTAVLVSNGGWGSVLAGLAAGVPVVVAPGAAADKPEVAHRVALSGAGINLRTSHPKPDAIARAVREVLANPAYAQRAREIGAELDRLGGAAAAVDLVERLAATKAPVLRVGSPWDDGATPLRET